MQVRIKLAALAMAGGTAALVLTGAPALASTHAASKAITGPEIAYGAVYGKAATANNPVIPVIWRGLVRRPWCLLPERPSPGEGPAPHLHHLGREPGGGGYRQADQQPEHEPEDLPLRGHDLRRLRRPGQQEHRQVPLDSGSRRGEGLLRRVRAEV